MLNKILDRKVNTWLRIGVLSLGFLAILFILFSYKRHIGTYIFDPGSTDKSELKAIIKDGKTVGYEFPSNALPGIIGEKFLWGDSSSLTVALALILGSFVGAIAQVVKLFNKKHLTKNFVNSLVIIILATIAIGFSSILSVLIISIALIALQSLLLLSAIHVEFYNKQYNENVKLLA